MHRRNLQDALNRYARRYPKEQGVIERFHCLLNEHPNCFERDCWHGHVTGSAWLLDPSQSQLLLTHHRKLDMWLQLGGHSDGDPDTAAVAKREALEESGLPVQLVSREILDIDIHTIPARKDDPSHEHFDVRFALQADSLEFIVSSESIDLAWVPMSDLESLTTEESILRMRRKWLAELA
ncbi:MAG TPA: NUDIX hydrolase [Gammaproteobacteria bacterium]|nr:NUDIX hydrolase [Gammaproteobacteria bacterium]